MSRALVLLAAIVFFRIFLFRASRHSPTQASAYMNSLDGFLSPEQLSSALNEISHSEKHSVRAADSR
jgi:hypothetical protein